MYPHGLVPTKTAIFDNFKSYKNRLDGIFFRNVANSVVQGGVFADNRYQADFDKSDSILMNATRVIGSTASYQEIVRTQNVKADHKDLIVGLELHSFARNPSNKGLTVQDIVFEGFKADIAEHSALVEIDREADDPWSGNFNYWTTFERIAIKDSDSPLYFDMIQAVNNSYKSVYLVDLDSSMKPSSSSAKGTSSVIANSNEMKAFIDRNRCTSVQSGEYLYCERTCLRSVTFAVDPGRDENIELKIRRTAPTRKNQHYEGSKDVLTHENFDRHERAMTEMEVLRYYTAALPPGQYTAIFVNGKTGENQWPTFVETIIDPALCSNTFDSSDVTLHVPKPRNSECDELVQNGDMEQPVDSSVPHWLQHSSLLEVAKGRGRRGSTAIAEVDVRTPYGALAQYIDVRCLTEGQTYMVQAWAFLEERGKGGSAISCEDERAGCPRLSMRFMTQEVHSHAYTAFEHAVSTSFAQPAAPKGWNLLQGLVTVSSTMARASRVAVLVDRRFTGRSLLIDDVSMTRIERDCSELVFNGDFSEETTLFWDQDNGSLDLISIKGNSALQHSRRKNSGAAITQRILTGCMKEGDRFLAKAKVKVLKRNGYPAHCNPGKVFGEAACPRLRLRAHSDYAQSGDGVFPHPENYIASADHGVTEDGWMTISEVFTATKADEFADQSVLYIDGPHKNLTVVVDEVSISPLEMNCKQLVLNGDAESGETAQFWRLVSRNTATNLEVDVDNSGNPFFRVTNRKTPSDGIVQRIDGRCLTLGSEWIVEAQVKLRSRSTGKFVACVPRTCPTVDVFAINNGGARAEENSPMITDSGLWVANEFNHVEVYVVITEELLANGGQFYLGFQRFDDDWDLLIDNISAAPRPVV